MLLRPSAVPGLRGANPVSTMLNIGPFELLLIFVIALLVLGPERLPQAVKTAGLWIGRFRRSFYKVKAEIERELNADEIRRQLHNEAVMEEIRDAKARVETVARETRRSADNLVGSETFDPGASADIVGPPPGDAAEAGAENETFDSDDGAADVQRGLYGTGQNPRMKKADGAEADDP